jgi:hypothetical protein
VHGSAVSGSVELAVGSSISTESTVPVTIFELQETVLPLIVMAVGPAQVPRATPEPSWASLL